MNTFRLTYKSQTIDLSASWKAETFRLVPGKTAVLDHQSDYEAPHPMRAVDMDAQAQVSLELFGQSKTAVLKQVAAIKRLVDGANQIAFRHWQDPKHEPVWLEVQLDGAERVTRWRIKVGRVDDSRSHYLHYENNSRTPKRAQTVEISLRLEPYGRGDPIYLHNIIPSDSSFLGDVDGDGLSDQWNATGSPTFSPTLFNWLHGQKAQSVQVYDTETQRIRSNGGVITGGNVLYGSIWIHVAVWDNPTARLVFIIGSSTQPPNSTGTASNISFTPDELPSIAVEERTDEAGATWYKIELIHQSLAPHVFGSMQIGKQSSIGSGIFYIDMAYLQNDPTPPGCWSGRSNSLRSRADNTNGFAFFNHVDFAHIPGDAPALVNQKLKHNYVFGDQHTSQYFLISRYRDAVALSSKLKTSIDSDSFTGTGWTDGNENISLSWFGRYKRHTFTAVGQSYDLTTWEAVNTIQFYFDGPRRVFAIMRASTTFFQIQLKVFYQYTVTGPLYPVELDLPPAKINLANDWRIIDLGTLILSDLIAPDFFDINPTGRIYITLSCERIAGTPIGNPDYLDFDVLHLMPTNPEFLTVRLQEIITDERVIKISGEHQKVIGHHGLYEPEMLGSCFELDPEIGNRILYLMAGDNLRHYPTFPFDISYEIIPRTRHLLP